MIEHGETVTFYGIYKRRSFWQWLTRQPQILQNFHVYTVMKPRQHPFFVSGGDPELFDK